MSPASQQRTCSPAGARLAGGLVDPSPSPRSAIHASGAHSRVEIAFLHPTSRAPACSPLPQRCSGPRAAPRPKFVTLVSQMTTRARDVPGGQIGRWTRPVRPRTDPKWRSRQCNGMIDFLDDDECGGEGGDLSRVGMLSKGAGKESVEKWDVTVLVNCNPTPNPARAAAPPCRVFCSQRVRRMRRGED